MRHKPRKSDTNKVREATATWREKYPEPDADGHRILKRLERDLRSVEVFTRLDLPAGKAAVVVRDCILADLNARTFESRLAKEEGILMVLKAARRGLKACRALLTDAIAENDALDPFPT